MSRTRDHRPEWAQGTLEQHHDHRTGPCDLTDAPKTWAEFEAQRGQRCCWFPGPYSTKYSAYKNAAYPKYRQSRAASRRATLRLIKEQDDA